MATKKISMLNQLHKLAFSIIKPNHPSTLAFYVTLRSEKNPLFPENLEKLKNQFNQRELSLNEYKLIAQRASPLFHVLFAGADPFMRDDLPELVLAFPHYAKSQLISITTCIPENPAVPEALSKICADCRNIPINLYCIIPVESLYDPAEPDLSPDEKYLNSLEHLQRLREKFAHLSFNVITAAGPQKEDELKRYLDFVRRRLKPDYHQVALTDHSFWDPDDDGRYDLSIRLMKNQAGWSSKKAGRFQRSFNELLLNTHKKIHKTQKLPYKCLAGRKLAVSDPTGIIYPCETLWFHKEKFPAFRDYRIGSFRVTDYRWPMIQMTDQYREITEFIKNKGCLCAWEHASACSLMHSASHWIKVVKKVFKPRRNA